MKNLHLKYLAEDSTRKISYSLFCRLKPFYLKQATATERETCLCKRHENLQFKVQKLKQLKLIECIDVDKLASQITCETGNKDCMYRVCDSCSDKKVDFVEFDQGKMVDWFEWKTKKIEKFRTSHADKSTGLKTISITLKEKERGTLKQLTDEFQEELSRCCKHLYNIKHQFMAIRQLKEKLTEEDCLIHVDFSENLTSKYHSEIQSMHFGASQRQISLHTGVIYTKDQKKSFCPISDNLNHGPSGIWGHLKPVLQLVRENFPSVSNLFFLSDGPTTQYRCKENFYLSSRVPLEMGFKTTNWNFHEAGHGKGAPDGVGAAVKREADRAVSHGTDITDAKSLYDTLFERDIAVRLFVVPDEAMGYYDIYIKEQSIKPVPGTMKLHQVYTSAVGEIFYRGVSCFCGAPRLCNCYRVEKSDLVVTNSKADPVRTSVPIFDESLIGNYCVVSYDDRPYPGLILGVDDGELEVQVMHSVGRNRFFWPLLDDVLWYRRENFITIIEQPEKVTNRHYQIQKEMWTDIAKRFNL